MDPDAALQELQGLTAKILMTSGDGTCPPLDLDDARRMAELFHGLDNWLHSGGALPRLWTMNR